MALFDQYRILEAITDSSGVIVDSDECATQRFEHMRHRRRTIKKSRISREI